MEELREVLVRLYDAKVWSVNKRHQSAGKKGSHRVEMVGKAYIATDLMNMGGG